MPRFANGAPCHTMPHHTTPCYATRCCAMRHQAVLGCVFREEETVQTHAKTCMGTRNCWLKQGEEHHVGQRPLKDNSRTGRQVHGVPFKAMGAHQRPPSMTTINDRHQRHDQSMTAINDMASLSLWTLVNDENMPSSFEAQRFGL